MLSQGPKLPDRTQPSLNTRFFFFWGKFYWLPPATRPPVLASCTKKPREKKKCFSLGFFVRCGAGQASLGSPCQSRQPISPLWELTGKLVSHPLKETLGKGHVFRKQSSPGLWVTGSGCPGQLLKPGPRLPAAGYPASFSARAKVTGCRFPGRSPVFLLPWPPRQFFCWGF